MRKNSEFGAINNPTDISPVVVAADFSRNYVDTTLNKGSVVLDSVGATQFLESQNLVSNKEAVKNLLAAFAVLYLVGKAKKHWKPVGITVGVLAILAYITKKDNISAMKSGVRDSLNNDISDKNVIASSSIGIRG
jgi:hypothetical protein